MEFKTQMIEVQAITDSRGFKDRHEDFILIRDNLKREAWMRDSSVHSGGLCGAEKFEIAHERLLSYLKNIEPVWAEASRDAKFCFVRDFIFLKRVGIPDTLENLVQLAKSGRQKFVRMPKHWLKKRGLEVTHENIQRLKNYRTANRKNDLMGTLKYAMTDEDAFWRAWEACPKRKLDDQILATENMLHRADRLSTCAKKLLRELAI